MKQTLLSLLMLLLPLMASAEAVEIDGIYYNLINKGKVAEVTVKPNRYGGNIVIPSSIIYNDITYSVTSIGNFAFQSCSLTSVTIPNSVTSIGEWAFMNCRELNSITIPYSITAIGEEAFSGCHFQSVHITDLDAWCKISFYDSYANPLSNANLLYLNGKEVKELVIPSTVTSIGNYVFNGCSGLTSVTIPNSVTSIGNYAFYYCYGLTSVTIPNSVNSIGNNAFEGCSGLTSFTIPNAITSIGSGAFSYCNDLTSVTIGSGVKYIHEQAFVNCRELTDVYCYAENVPSTITEAFNGSYIEYATLHVPAPAINAYNNTEPWSSFKEIVALDMQYYTLTYMVDGTKYKECWIEEGAKLTSEPAPTKEGYKFSGWSEIPATMPDHDVTITGTFIANTYLPGDANGDGQITVTDIGVIVDIILGKTPANARKQQEVEPE